MPFGVQTQMTKACIDKDAMESCTEYLQVMGLEQGTTLTADALQNGTRTLLIEVDHQNPGGILSAAISCTVELKIPRKTQT